MTTVLEHVRVNPDRCRQQKPNKNTTAEEKK